MSDIMRPIPFGQIIDWALTEYQTEDTIFGIKKLYASKSNKKLTLFGEQLEIPFGPAAGPHTQLTQNIIASYVAGSRFFELKTVQVLDGEDLPVSKPCIYAADEGYNVEWSTELRIPKAYEEYIKGWFALKLLSKEFELGDPDGFIFNMSVGYDLEGIKTQKIDDFIEGMKDAANTPIWQSCKQWALDNLSKFKKVDAAFVEQISPKVCRSITLSTLHGCPPAEIERIANYLITEKKLNTYIKCNPTLLGYEYARKTLDAIGFDYIAFDDHHFKADLQFADAAPMIRRLIELANSKQLAFGVKLTNTFPVAIAAEELPGTEMYMSGRSLFPLSMEVANRLTKEFGGTLPISYSGGADYYNIDAIFAAGIWPITLATTLLKPGGYQRLGQMAESLENCEYKPFDGVDAKAVQSLVDSGASDPYYKKPIKPLPNRKMKEKVPLIDCFAAPCRDGCPIEQDIPAYLRLVEEGKHLEALKVITERNPLPFITGTICSHRCMDKCTRSFYEESVHVRDVKLQAAEKGFSQLVKAIKKPEVKHGKIAVVGGGAAGIAAAYFLAKSGHAVTIFEKRAALGGIVRFVIPEFRIGNDAIEKDIELIRALGVEIRTESEVESVATLQAQGFERVIIATGAWNPGKLELESGSTMNVLEFLEALKTKPASVKLGENVVIIGGGNTAMDAARAAKRVKGVKQVSLVYRRTKRYMPADEEELALAIEDGVVFCELLAPLHHTNGILTCTKMELGAPDASGRRSPVATSQTVEVIANTIIAAVGESVDTNFYTANGIKTDNRGKAQVNTGMETSLSGVYVIGDAMRGPATVVEAIADAIACAKSIAEINVDTYAARNVNSNSTHAHAKKGFLYKNLDSCAQTRRCLECPTICECCVDVCPNRANIAVMVGDRPQIVHVDYMCNECGNCETFCPYSSAPYKEKFTLFANRADFDNSENEGFLLLDAGKSLVRLDGNVAEYDSSGLPDGLHKLIQSVRQSTYLILA